VHNGTRINGLAGETAEYLKVMGIRVTETGNADDLYEITTIVDYTGNADLITKLTQILALPEIKIYNRFDPDTPVDLLLTLGNDWAYNNPLP